MKTLKKGNEFKRVKDFSKQDYQKIDDLLSLGWNYCSKSEWKKATRIDEPKNEKKEGKKRGRSK